MNNLKTLLNSPEGIAALAYVQGTSDEQGYTLQGAGVDPFGMSDASDARSDLSQRPGQSRGTPELYVKLGENAAQLARFATTLAEIAEAGAQAQSPAVHLPEPTGET